MPERVLDRIAGSKSEINGLVDVLNRGGMPINSTLDIYAVCDLVKMWLRQLPEATFPSTSYWAAIATGGVFPMPLEDRDI